VLCLVALQPHKIILAAFALLFYSFISVLLVICCPFSPLQAVWPHNYGCHGALNVALSALCIGILFVPSTICEDKHNYFPTLFTYQSGASKRTYACFNPSPVLHNNDKQSAIVSIVTATSGSFCKNGTYFYLQFVYSNITYKHTCSISPF